LSQIPGLRIIGNAREKAGVVSFVLDGIRTEEVGGLLDQEGIAVRSGHHCAQPILRRFGLEATVRASLAPYNTRDDIHALVAACRPLLPGTPTSAAPSAPFPPADILQKLASYIADTSCFAADVRYSGRMVVNVTPQRAWELISKGEVEVVDVRDPGEWEKG